MAKAKSIRFGRAIPTERISKKALGGRIFNFFKKRLTVRPPSCIILLAAAMSSKHARQYNIRAYKSKLKVLAGDRIEEMKSGGGFDFVKLPSYKGFPIFVCLNYNEDDEFLIFTYRNNSINIDNCINVLAFSSYNNEKESFAIFSDGTIYVKTVDEKGSHITVYRINNEGDFYKLN